MYRAKRDEAGWSAGTGGRPGYADGVRGNLPTQGRFRQTVFFLCRDHLVPENTFLSQLATRVRFSIIGRAVHIFAGRLSLFCWHNARAQRRQKWSLSSFSDASHFSIPWLSQSFDSISGANTPVLSASLSLFKTGVSSIRSIKRSKTTLPNSLARSWLQAKSATAA